MAADVKTAPRPPQEERSVTQLGYPNGYRKEPADGAKALTKSLRLLCAFTEEQSEWGVSELARHFSMSKSSVSTTLATLAAFGLVTQNPVTRRFSLGLECMHLGYVAANRLSVREIAYPYLEQLRGAGDWIVYMAVPWSDQILYVEALYPTLRRINYSAQGRVLPMYCTGIGKAMLASMGEAYIERYLEETPLHAYTPNTFANPASLRAELERTRERGYATDLQEQMRNIQCVAAPVLGRDGQVLAAISVSASDHILPRERMPEVAGLVVPTANEIARIAMARS
jgi:IclR family KDG regulon transcriptional repressor